MCHDANRDFQSETEPIPDPVVAPPRPVKNRDYRTGREKAQDRYERWWLGKMVRPAGRPDMIFRRVMKVEVFGPPSFVYGGAFLTYEDGSCDTVHHEEAYVPRKCDMEVLDEQEKQKKEG